MVFNLNHEVEAARIIRHMLQPRRYHISRYPSAVKREPHGAHAVDMKSWAVPKGPSLDTKDKRLAVQVEDHPIAYSGFEGTIAAGQYGAGRVIIWDKGTWTPLGSDPHKDYLVGNLKFTLHGHKLGGNRALVRMRVDRVGGKQPPWLLIKEKDGFTRSAQEFNVVEALPDSVANSKSAASAAQWV